MGLDRALAGLGVPSRTEILKDAASALHRMPMLKLRSERLLQIRANLRQAGTEVLAKGAGVLPPAEWPLLPAPLAMTRDGTQFHLGVPTIALEDGEWLHELDVELRHLTRQALRAGRGLDFAFSDFQY